MCNRIKHSNANVLPCVPLHIPYSAPQQCCFVCIVLFCCCFRSKTRFDALLCSRGTINMETYLLRKCICGLSNICFPSKAKPPSLFSAITPKHTKAEDTPEQVERTKKEERVCPVPALGPETWTWPDRTNNHYVCQGLK